MKTAARGWFIGIKAKIIFAFLTVGLLSTLIIAGISAYSLKTGLEEQVQEGLLALAEAKEGQVFAYLDAIESRTIDFSSDGYIRDALRQIIETNSPRSVSDLNQHLLINKKSLDQTIRGILVIDQDGVVRASTLDKEIGKNKARQEYVQEGLKNIFVSEITDESLFDNEQFQSDRLVVAAPLTDKEQPGKVLGLIVIIFAVNKLTDILSGDFQVEKGTLPDLPPKIQFETYLVDKNGFSFVHAAVAHPGLGEHPTNLQVNTLPVQHCLSGHEGMSDGMVGSYENYNQVRVIGSSRCISQRKWTLLLEANRDLALAPVRRTIYDFVGVALFLSLLIIFSGWFIGSKITKPILMLNAAERAVEEGKLHTRLNIKTGDELQHLGERFNITTRALEQKEAAQTQFFTTASHQLKTPLTPMKSELQRLIQTQLSAPQQKEALKIVLRNMVRLEKLIQDLLEISRIKSKQLILSRTKEDVRLVITEVVSLLQSLAESKHVSITVGLKPLPLVVLDKVRIMEVLANLLDNAIKYASSEIRIRASLERTNLLVCVEDDGPGIPKGSSHNLFQPFFKANHPDDKTGTGLGLAICKSIIEAHQGKIWFERKNRFTSFCFTIPLTKN